MEVVLSGPQKLPEPLRRGTPVPLSQLVEESRSKANAPNHLLESKIYAKLKSNSLIQAEPAELHFSGFELGKDYVKILKLINISSEVMNIHVIPTQTKHFQTTYTKKYRLIPGLAYTLRVRLCPDEWRYFYDCIRVHCKGEENLLIPVHAYPVIDDLCIPPHIDLSAVPLGNSVCQAIPLRCSCPVDFEFQVQVIQPHEAFSVQPLTGVIPANGEENITVTFSPFQYMTCQVTFQLIVSQFNSRPFLCTVSGSCTPHLALSELGKKAGLGDAVRYTGPSPVTQVPRQSKTKLRSTKEADKSKTPRGQASVQAALKPPVDVCTPAGVARMLITDSDKLSSKDLKEAISSGSMAALQNRQVKEALFRKKVQQHVTEEQANLVRWQVRVGEDPVSERSRRQIAEEREIALHEYMVQRGDERREDGFAAGRPELSSRRLLCAAGQAGEGAPSFQFFCSLQWDLRRRALSLFQQAARKTVIRCRVDRRLTCLRELCRTMKNSPLAQKVEEDRTFDLKMSPDRIFPFSFPVFSASARSNLVEVPVDPIDVTVTTHVPFFKLQVPQRYKLMGYRPVSAWEAFNSYIPTSLARPLRTAKEPVLNEAGAAEAWGDPQKGEAEEAVCFSFSAPEALLTPFPANPLRIFNPAPGLQAYRPTPKYLETDLEFHLCPLPRYPIPESGRCGRATQTPTTQKKHLGRKEGIAGFMTWKDLDSIASKLLSSQPSPSSDFSHRR
ncbi:hypothetical protein CgunFtcFv8_018427 [Champsocephalus gunnari]|uniref:CFAP65 fourth Ig-like domain-containing protein n=1 Tax=Champsocephalus gunnari TaxID=52237 RepID=A0AAN8GUC5_CHAGU|nr:hypothetical protein CgunFtcFv8_018427 [Champsocephalus gunnari]